MSTKSQQLDIVNNTGHTSDGDFFIQQNFIESLYCVSGTSIGAKEIVANSIDKVFYFGSCILVVWLVEMDNLNDVR